MFEAFPNGFYHPHINNLVRDATYYHYLVFLVARLMQLRDSSNCSRCSSCFIFSCLLMAITCMIDSFHVAKMFERPWNPFILWMTPILCRRVNTLACSLKLSTNNLSSLDGLGGSLGIWTELEEDILIPGFCWARAASIFFLSISKAWNCHKTSCTRNRTAAAEPLNGIAIDWDWVMTVGLVVTAGGWWGEARQNLQCL